MLAAVKNKCHKWSFVNSYRMPNMKVNVFECKMCKVSKFVYCDHLTHRHIKTEYVMKSNGVTDGATMTKTPACMVRENLLFE